MYSFYLLGAGYIFAGSGFPFFFEAAPDPVFFSSGSGSKGSPAYKIIFLFLWLIFSLLT